VPPQAGVVMLGATPWIYNYNVPIIVELPCDLDSVMKAARRVARKIGERGGGLLAVQAMALPHGKNTDEGCMTIEIACNLLDVSVTGPEAVQAEVERLCSPGIDNADVIWKVQHGYVTNMSIDGIMEELAC
jgi:glutamate formiminotransferase